MCKGLKLSSRFFFCFNRNTKGECHGVYTDYIKSLQKSTNESPVKNPSSRPTQGKTNQKFIINSIFFLPRSSIKCAIIKSILSSIN